MLKRLNRSATVLVAGTAVLCAASLAHADPIKPGQQQGLGLMGADVPDELKKISADPYAAPGDCEQIDREIIALDQILGPDRDAEAQRSPSTIDTTVAPLVRSFIPYRNVVRIVTGANRKDAELTQAAMAGWERRGFLRGLQKHCGAPPPLDASTQGQPAAAIAPPPVEDRAPPADLPRAQPISDVTPLPPQDEDPAADRGYAPPLDAGAPMAAAGSDQPRERDDPYGPPPAPAYADRHPAAAYRMTVAAEPGR